MVKILGFSFGLRGAYDEGDPHECAGPLTFSSDRVVNVFSNREAKR